jgi:hypothetical protein
MSNITISTITLIGMAAMEVIRNGLTGLFRVAIGLILTLARFVLARTMTVLRFTETLLKTIFSMTTVALTEKTFQ